MLILLALSSSTFHLAEIDCTGGRLSQAPHDSLAPLAGLRVPKRRPAAFPDSIGQLRVNSHLEEYAALRPDYQIPRIVWCHSPQCNAHRPTRNAEHLVNDCPVALSGNTVETFHLRDNLPAHVVLNFVPVHLAANFAR